MTSVKVNGVELGLESFGRVDDPLVLLVGGTTMLSWPDALCRRLASGRRRVVRYDLRDSGASTTLNPMKPAYDLRDLVTDSVALVGALGARTAHLGGAGVGGMVAQVAALDHADVFTALTLVGTRPVAPGPVDKDLPDHDRSVMAAFRSRPAPDWTDRGAVASFVAERAAALGDDPEEARATAAKVWGRTPTSEPAVHRANQFGMAFRSVRLGDDSDSVVDKGYVGGTKDTTTGLTHLGAREYDPVTGRFLSADPITGGAVPVHQPSDRSIAPMRGWAGRPRTAPTRAGANGMKG
jgi:RHS repeat-associated protein